MKLNRIICKIAIGTLPMYGIGRIYLLVLCVFGVISISTNLSAQEGHWHPVYHNYTTNDGLPSMEGYSSTQDKEGYLWFATDHGVARFNGREFKVFTTKDGLQSNTVFNIEPDDKGRLWFLSNTAKLCYYENGKIQSYKYNDKLVAHFKGKPILTYLTWKFENDEVIISTMNESPIHIDSLGKVFVPKRNQKNASISLFLYKNQLVKQTNKNLIDLEFSFNINLDSEVSFYSEPPSRLRSTMGKIDTSTIYYSSGKNLITSNGKDYHVQQLPEKILNISQIKNDLWISFYEGGVRRYIWKDGNLVPDVHFFQDKSITSAFMDDEGHFWFTSYEGGVFKVSDLNTVKLEGIPLLSAPINSIALQENNLLITTNLTDLHVFNTRRNHLEKFDLSTPKATGSTFFKLSQHGGILIQEFIENSESYLYILKNGKKEFLARILLTTARKFGDQSYLIGNLTGVWLINNTTKKMLYENDIKYMEFLDDHQLWIGNYEVVRIIDLNTLKDRIPKNVLLQQRMNDILKTKEYTVFGTHGNGLLIGSEKKVIELNSSNGFPRDFIYRIHQSSDGAIWALGHEGITRITEESDGIFHYTDFPAFKLMADKLIDFTIGDDHVYVATNTGIIRIKNRFNEDNIPLPRLYFTNIEINGERQASRKLELPYSVETALIKFDAVSFENKQVFYRYRYNPKNKWIIINENFVRPNSLPSGSYTLEIQATIDGKRWTKSRKMQIIVATPFWNTWWFTILFGLVLIGITVFLARIRERILKKKHWEEREILKMQQAALSQQMNPHFIFNAMGAVQNSILKGDTLQANNYLVKFSRLLRTGLNASRMQLISIDKDRDLIENYLSVEQSRMNHVFTFEICINCEEPANFLLPPFLLQPFIENALFHGLSDKRKNGHVQVIYEECENSICCTISDNGVGRGATKTTLPEPEKHTSHGSDIAFQRIILHGKSKKFKPQIEVVDLYNDQNEPAGTKVLFTLPLIKKLC